MQFVLRLDEIMIVLDTFDIGECLVAADERLFSTSSFPTVGLKGPHSQSPLRLMLGGQEISYISPIGRRTGLALNVLHDLESPYARHETYSVNSIYGHYRT